MQRKITFYLLVLFLVFLIMRDAAGTGDTANSFFDWVGDGLDKTHQFVTNAIGDDTAAPGQS